MKNTYNVKIENTWSCAVFDIKVKSLDAQHAREAAKRRAVREGAYASEIKILKVRKVS